MFHVPEQYRVTEGMLASNSSYENNGAFLCPGIFPGRHLSIIASDGDSWEHVSIHVSGTKGKSHMPTWDEMCHAKSLFWDDEDTVMQLHPPKSEWVNNHPHTLHLWRPADREIPLPNSLLVGDKTKSYEKMNNLYKKFRGNSYEMLKNIY